MAGQLKSTKKYEKKHLKGELERRRAVKKTKQRHQQAEKKRARRSQDHGPEQATQDDLENREQKKSGVASLKDMTMDEFFQGGYDFNQTTPAPKLKKRKRADADRMEDLSRKEAASEDQELSDASLESEGSSFTGHKQDLEALAEKDPDFYRYLQENDSELLDFDAPMVGPEGDEDEPAPPSGSKSSRMRKGEGGKEPRGTTKITIAIAKKWKTALERDHSLSALKEVILAFRAAAHTDTDQELELKYVVPSAEVFHEILVIALQQVPAALQHHFPTKEAANGRLRVNIDSKKHRNIYPLLSMHVASVVQLLETIADGQTLKATLSSLEPLLPYVISLKKPLKHLLKSIVAIWSDPSGDETVRINAFLLIRRLTVIADNPTREAVLKTVYQGLVRGSRNTTVHTLSAINLMKNSAVELWRLDGDLGYTTGFGYIRQLALHLRNSITQPTKESHRAIYNWQYVHSLDFWSRVLATHCSPEANAAIKRPSDSALHPLIYPLVQITLGALRLLCTPAYFPLRFHLTKSLLRISSATKTYIPLAPSLLEILQSPQLRTPPRPATLRPLDFNAALHAPKSYLRTRVYQDGVGEQVVFWLAEFFGVWAKSIAFPELIIPPTFFLKRWLKEVSHPAKRQSSGKGGPKPKGNANNKLNSSIKLLLQKLNANATFVETQRAKVDFAVSNRASVESFLRDVAWEEMPLGAYVQRLREQREEREKLLEESRHEHRRMDEVEPVSEDEGEDEGEDEDEASNEVEEGVEEGGSSNDDDSDEEMEDA